MPLRLANMEEPIPGYRLMERLGRGGFGEVWKVEAPGGLHKAIKFVYGDLEAAGDDSKGAEQEWKALNRVKTIRHPYILSLERFDIIDGQLLIVMELADRNLWDRFRECRSQNLIGVPRKELLSYLEEAAEALDLMNTQYQLQHLDIKPQNLFLVHNHIKVADFGLAKDLEGVRATVTGGVTPVYAAPETFEGWVSRFSDQYSLAIVYQEILTGVRPFNGTNTRQLLMQHISGVPDLSPLPPAERAIIGRALSKTPDQRFPFCMDMIQALLTLDENAPHPIERNSTSMPISATGTANGTQTQPMAANPLRDPRIESSHKNPSPSVLRSGSMPSLITQSQIFKTQGIDEGGSSTSGKMTQARPSITQTGRMPTMGLAPPEQTGNGVLFPAFVIGLGHTGLIVLQQLRQAVHERFGPSVTMPHIHYLQIDTDAETLQEATAAPPPVALGMKEVILARLNRPGHYLKREGLPPVDSWLSNHLLYRLPRNPATVGVRAFGRLALCDNYRSIIVRIRQEMETFIQGDALAESDRQTNLGMRSNRPRVYIAGSLGGGTGSGMFLDLAYILKHELRSIGYLKPEVIGMFLLPPVDRTTTKSQAVANAYAALVELNHFSSPGSCFETRYDNREPPIVDALPPFSRVTFLTMPKTQELTPLRQLANQAAGALFQEMLTPMGRVVEDCRAAWFNAHPVEGLKSQTFGTFRLTWPRQRLLETSVRRFAQATLVRWTAKDHLLLHDSVTKWLLEEWDRRQLDLESLVNRLQFTPVNAKSADELVKSLVEPLTTATASKLDSYAACVLLDQIFDAVGKPDSEKEGIQFGIGVIFGENASVVTREYELKLAEMAVYFIEEPLFRLAGAEEAIQQLSAKLKSTLDTLEPLAADLFKELSDVFTRLFPLVGSLDHSGLDRDKTGKARSAVTHEVIELMKTYVQTRYRHLTVQSAIAIYRGLLGNAPEYLREVNFCRVRLTEIARNVAEISRAEATGSARGPGQYILPPNCRTLDEAAELFLKGLTRDDLAEFDKLVQSQIRRQFRALVNVCLETNDHSLALKAILEEQGMGFLGRRLESANPAKVFFRYRDQVQIAQREIQHAYDESFPELSPTRSRENTQVCVLGVPPDESGELFRQLARDVLTDEDLVIANCADEIVFYREQRYISIQDLPQMTPQAREAYEHSMGADQLSPHSRGDVGWREVKG